MCIAYYIHYLTCDHLAWDYCTRCDIYRHSPYRPLCNTLHNVSHVSGACPTCDARDTRHGNFGLIPEHSYSRNDPVGPSSWNAPTVKFPLVRWEQRCTLRPGTVLPDAPKDAEGHPVDIGGRRMSFVARQQTDREVRAALSDSQVSSTEAWYVEPSINTQIVPMPQGWVSVASIRQHSGNAGGWSSDVWHTTSGSSGGGSYRTEDGMLSRNAVIHTRGHSPRPGAGRPAAASGTAAPTMTAARQGVPQAGGQAQEQQPAAPGRQGGVADENRATYAPVAQAQAGGGFTSFAGFQVSARRFWFSSVAQSFGM